MICRIIVVLALPFLVGCATTTLNEVGPDGRYHTVFQTQADIDHVVLKTSSTSFVATKVNHSDPTKAGAVVIEKTLTGATAFASVISQPASPWAAITTVMADIFRSMFTKR